MQFRIHDHFIIDYHFSQAIGRIENTSSTLRGYGAKNKYGSVISFIAFTYSVVGG